MTFTVINGNPNAVRDPRYKKEDLIGMADYIREEPEIFMEKFGYDKETVLELADIYEEASRLEGDVTIETVGEMWSRWIKEQNYQTVCESLEKELKNGKPVKIFGLEVTEDNFDIHKSILRELLVDGIDPQFKKIMDSWAGSINKPVNEKRKPRPKLSLVPNKQDGF